MPSATNVQKLRKLLEGKEALMGVTEVAECLGIATQNLTGSRADGRPRSPVGLPEPVQELVGGRIWLADEIREFAAVYETRRHKKKQTSKP